jgi:nicotinamide riboside transporter PnuC
MSKIIMYLLMGGCLIGQVLVTKHKRSGYALWTIADSAWAIFNFSQYKVIGAIEQGILWSIFTIISLWGFIVYKKDKK